MPGRRPLRPRSATAMRRRSKPGIRAAGADEEKFCDPCRARVIQTDALAEDSALAHVGP